MNDCVQNIFKKFFGLSFLKQKFLLIIVATAIFLPSYTAAGYYYFGTPSMLPLTVVDHFFSFAPWTFAIYVSYFFYLILAGLIMPDYPNIFRFFKIFGLMAVFHMMIFILFPTKAPRPDLALFQHIDIVSLFLARFIHMADAVTNCFPSLHVSNAFLCAFVVGRFHKSWKPFLWIWAIAIAISTMTTKQHYFLDVVASSIISTIFYLSFYRKPIGESDIPSSLRLLINSHGLK